MKYFFLMDKDVDLKFNVKGTNNRFEKIVSNYKILSSDNCDQILELKNDGFIIILGTMIYDDKIGIEMLKNLYLSYDGNVNKVRDRAIGNYSVIIKKNDVIEIFSDKNSIHKIYYCLKEKSYVCNSYYFLAKHLDKVSAKVNNLIEDSFQYAVLGNETIFEDIKILAGNEKLVLNNKTGVFELVNFELSDSNIKIKEGLDDAAEQLADLIKEKATSFARHYPEIAINLTGGLDSRLVLAAYLSVGVKPKLLYGVGNSILTNTKKRDLELVSEYAKRFDLDLRLMNWNNDNDIIDKDWEVLLDKYGEHFKIYSGNENIFNEYEKIALDSDLIDFGYFGEMLRNLDWIDNEKVGFIRKEELSNRYFHYNMKSFVNDSKSLDNHFLNKISKFSSKEHISAREFQNLFILYRYSADTKMINFINFIGGNSSILLSEPEIQDFIKQIPLSFMKNKKFMIKVLYNLDKEVLEIPIFSHCQDWKYDGSNFSLTPLRANNIILKNKILNFARFFKMEKFIRKIHRELKYKLLKIETDINLEELKKMNDYINLETKKLIQFIEFDDIIDVKKFEVEDPRALIEYWENLYMMYKLKS